VNLRGFRLIRRDMGQDIRAWPMLALLLLVVAVAIGCVLWFMREAMRNERLAVQQKIVEAYRGQLAFLEKHVEEEWRREMERLERQQPGPALFATAVQEHWADAIICLDESGRPIYPQTASTARDVEANAQLLALEKLGDETNPRFREIADRLRQRVTDYGSSKMPAAQRRFLMRELQKLHPETDFPTLFAEDLAAKFLDKNGVSVAANSVQEAPVGELWACATPGRRVIALYTTATLRTKIESLAIDFKAPAGVRLSAIAPNRQGLTDSAMTTMPLAPLMPGWQLALFLDDRTAFDTAADGRVATYLWTGSTVIAGMILLIVLIARGFTRQVQLARMKNDLVATVSHELKTPLTAMRALVDTLLESSTLDEKSRREYLELLSKENTRLSRLIDNFLTFSRMERNRMNFKFVQLRPEQVIESAIAAMGERCHAPECQFDSETQADLPLVLADENALTTALLNLLDNAWKYTGEKKRITLRTSSHNGSVCFCVEDNGIGIPQAESRRVFQRFYQVDQQLSRAVEGCGLGLSIVRSIVNAHRGTVSISSKVGQGSAFTIEIPAAAAS
jgi:signal transduction histidine kinase